MLDRLVAEWTAGLDTPARKIAAIAEHLRHDFSYSLTFERHRREPLMAFLLDDRTGHCEYFASAMALLARSAGLPARVVAGYRVTEKNSLGGYWIVRESNATPGRDLFPGQGLPHRRRHAERGSHAACALHDELRQRPR